MYSKKLSSRDLSRFYRLSEMSGPVGRADGQTQGMRTTTNVPVFPELPKGEFITHPEYGELDFSPKTLREYVKNWEDNVRRTALPVDIDHKNESACGWVKRLYYQPGDGVFADVEWNRLGQRLLADKQYKFISPQFGDHTNERTGETFKHVVIALTITNFPFLKDMPSVSLSEHSRKPIKLVDRARDALLAEGYSNRDRRLYDRELRAMGSRPRPTSSHQCRLGCRVCSLTAPRARRSYA
jgi:hypothetical protein